MTKLDKTLNDVKGAFASFTTNKGTFSARVKSVGKTFVTLNVPYLDKPLMRVRRNNIQSIDQKGQIRYSA